MSIRIVKIESDIEEQAFPDIEKDGEKEPADSSNDQEREKDDEEDTDWAKLADNAPSAED